MEFDPQAFQGTAEYYSMGRPPYSELLADAMVQELSLDGTGQLLDVGCGPGVLELELAGLFLQTVALDPEIGMLREGRRRCKGTVAENVRWLQGVAEDIPSLNIGPCRAVTFGQSFHRVRQFEVAEFVYNLLEPGGSLVLISNEVEGRPLPDSPGYPEPRSGNMGMTHTGTRYWNQTLHWPPRKSGWSCWLLVSTVKLASAIHPLGSASSSKRFK